MSRNPHATVLRHLPQRIILDKREIGRWRALAAEAMMEPEGEDWGPLSHEERNRKLLSDA